jgi:pSer/pThr/pTyr-binding forkhead associated (FHA) protein
MSLNPVETEDESAEDLAHLQQDLDPGQALLLVKRGPNAGSSFVIDAGTDVTSLGRNPDSDVFLDDVTVSRRHAEVHRTSAAGLEVCDVGSLNGTYVNGDRVERVALAEGDQLQVGKYRLVVVGGTGVVD